VAETLDVDVAVVGAGLAGLTAAHALGEAGCSVAVLEARDRVGGRVVSEPGAGGALFELGAQFVGPGQRRIAALARSLGVETFPTHAEGLSVLELAGRRHRFPGIAPRINPAVLLDVARGRARLERMARRVPVEAPWTAPRAAEWDRQSFGAWIERHTLTSGARTFFTLAVQAVWSVDPEEVSLLHVLFYAHAAGGLAALLETEGGGQERRFDGGAALVPERLAGRLGESVRLSSPVRRIAASEDGLSLAADELEVRARRAVVAVPPALADRIEFEPPLGGRRAQLHQRMGLGTVAKCIAVYAEPFWREDGLSGQGGSDRGPVDVTFDVSPRAGRPGMLLGFVQSGHARALAERAPEERRAAVLEAFGRLFGDRARRPEAYAERFWAEEEWTRGCPAGIFGPGAWTAFGPALRAPIGRLHWAGTETATAWMGYMDGAVQSGRRAAREVLRALR
jgi:monoamine oxidase